MFDLTHKGTKQIPVRSKVLTCQTLLPTIHDNMYICISYDEQILQECIPNISELEIKEMVYYLSLAHSQLF